MTHRPSRPLLLAFCLTLGLAAAGCWQPGAPLVAPASVIQVVVPEGGSVTAALRLAPMDAAGRRLLAAGEPWKKADIHHMTVSLYRGNDAAALVTETVTQANLDGTLVFSNLRTNTSYRLVAQAWADAGEASRIDDGEADVASCTTSFTTASDDRVDAGAIQLKLRGVPTAAKTKGSSIEVTDGGIVYVTPPPPAAATFAGSGTAAYLDGTGTAAQFNTPNGIATDTAGNVYVADTNNHRIRKITPEGVVTTLAGSGSQGNANGTGTAAEFKFPANVAVDGSGNVYVVDRVNQLIRKITPAGVVTTLAGSTSGFAEGTGAAAWFWGPKGLAVDAGGTLYIADSGNQRIRKLTSAGVVTTFAGDGTNAVFGQPTDLAFDSGGNLFVADYNKHCIFKVTSAGVVSTFAGSGTAGNADGTGTAAEFNNPAGVAVDGGNNVYVAEYGNHRIRKITPAGVVTTLAGSTQGFAEGAPTSAKFQYPNDVAVDGNGTVYVADTANHRIRKIQ